MILNDQLHTFTTVAAAGSFSKAAEQLYISSPAVIKQMNTLEEKLGFAVLTRTHQGVSLTPAGKILYDEAVLLSSHFQETLETARRAAQPEVREISVGTSIFKPFQPFMKLWEQCAPSFPGYSLKIVPFADDHNTISSTVKSLGKQFDFLVAACNSRTWLKQVSFHKLWDDPFCAAIPRGHPLARRKKLRPEDLAGETLYLFQRGDAPSVDAVWDTLERIPRLRILSTSYYDMDLFNQAASEGRLILSIASWKNVHPSFTSVPITWNLTTPYGLLYAKKAPPGVRKFIRILEGAE